MFSCSDLRSSLKEGSSRKTMERNDFEKCNLAFKVPAIISIRHFWSRQNYCSRSNTWYWYF